MYSLRGSWVFTEVKSKLTYIVIIINIIIVIVGNQEAEKEKLASINLPVLLLTAFSVSQKVYLCTRYT